MSQPIWMKDFMLPQFVRQWHQNLIKSVEVQCVGSPLLVLLVFDGGSECHKILTYHLLCVSWDLQQHFLGSLAGIYGVSLHFIHLYSICVILPLCHVLFFCCGPRIGDKVTILIIVEIQYAFFCSRTLTCYNLGFVVRCVI